MTRTKRLIPILFAICLAMALFACGSDGNGVKRDVTPPVITPAEQFVGYVEDEVKINSARAVDDEDGEVPVVIEVFAPSGKQIGVIDGKFVPHESGEYEIVYYATDRSGNTAEKRQILTVRAAADKPRIEIGNHKSSVTEGELYDIPVCTVSEENKEIAVHVEVTDPTGRDVNVIGGKFFVDRIGVYVMRFSATLSGGSKIAKTVSVISSYGQKTVNGVDGDISDEMYTDVTRTILGGLRGLESIYVKTVRRSDGLYLAFDASEDVRVSAGERIEVFFDVDGKAKTSTDGAKKLCVFPDGRIEYYEFRRGMYKIQTTPDYAERAVYAVKLGRGTTLAAGNTDDGGYTAELFVPNAYLDVNADGGVYMTLGCVREGDGNGWDGWNEFPVFPDPLTPYRYVEVRADGSLFNDNRLYRDPARADGNVDDKKYTGDGVARTTFGGLRNLEGAEVRIARGVDGIYAAFSVASDKRVNDFDRVEICINAGLPTDRPNTSCLQFWIHSTGAMVVLKGNGRAYTEFVPEHALPAAAASYGKNTTPNKNDDEDGGYYCELYVPYAMFDEYTDAHGVDGDTRLGITFGIWRVSENYGTGLVWGDDPNKDWDGWSHGQFCDPLIPNTYAVLMPDGRIVTQSEIIDIIGDPTDPSVDGVLDEEYWTSAAVLDIPQNGQSDGLRTMLYRAETGLRAAFTGQVRRFTSKDAIAFYVSTKDSSYELGGLEGKDDKYEVFGQYASEYDYCFQIRYDRSVAAYRGKYKDWAERITDLSAVSLQIVKSENGVTVEMFIPYSFFTAPDGFAPTKDDTLGVTVRLAGENDRGSVIWNNLHYAGIYADSESPASYVRLDKNNRLYASISNASEMRVDGKFDESVYEMPCAHIEFGASSVKLYRTSDGIYGRLDFGNRNSVSIVASTLGHGLAKPYVYDYLITVYRDGRVESSFGNSHGFYDSSLYSSYCAPRAVFDGDTAELYIPYDYLSRYNIGSDYGDPGYMRITHESPVKIAAAASCDTAEECTYNGRRTVFDLLDPTTYADYAVKEN